jgi:glyoxylase-like metal-dependent hydrolase (beta-lactamase superfamily II)
MWVSKGPEMEIVPGIYQLKIPIPDNPLGHLNCYLIEGKDGWLMVDTGWHTTEAFSSLNTGLRGLGLALSDIATIIVTHVHPDHFGLAGRIKHMSPATRLLTHRWESDLIESRYIKFSELRDKIAAMLERHGVPIADLSSLKSASMPALQFVTVTLPDHTLYGGEIISTGVYDLEIIWTPGHSPGHICLYEPQNQFLFSGDHILPSTSPNISYHVQSGDNPLGDYISALRKVQNLPVTKVLPAHEHIFTDLRGRIEQIISHHNRRKAEIEQIIMKETHNAYDISRQITWDTPGLVWEQLPPLHKRLAVTETIAHLECMRWEGQLRRIIKDNSVLYLTV